MSLSGNRAKGKREVMEKAAKRKERESRGLGSIQVKSTGRWDPSQGSDYKTSCAMMTSTGEKYAKRFQTNSIFFRCPNKNVNFVTGVNGSGKSAVLLGLVLGLFAESKQTKRYSRVQDFVQKGRRRAVVQVTLRNDGEDAYKPELYGKAITFKRTISDTGASAVSLVGETSHKVSGKAAREEGARIQKAFNISVDNPIVILQQDQAKELLKMESPAKLYNFFVVSTSFCSKLLLPSI